MTDPIRSTPRLTARRACLGAALALGLLAHGAPQAQTALTYPQKTIRLVVPFPPGGYADNLSRLIASDLSQTFGHPVVVENRAGAGGMIGADAVAKSAPDGYTLLMGTIGTHAINSALYRKMTYDALKDFAPIAFVADAETVLVVPPASASRTVAALIAQAKARPDQVTYASAGPGSTSHLTGELFKSATETAIVHVPYKGNSPALTDLMAGQVSLSFATMQTALPFIRSGKLTALATLGASRSAALPAVPTLEEAGVKGVLARNWIGLFAAAGTPEPILARLAGETDRIMRSPDVQAKLQNEGLKYTAMGPEAFAAFVRAEAAQWAKVVRAVGVQAD
jgi:tripartite-type tricarboxylate transporter receptor subunit TctC